MRASVFVLALLAACRGQAPEEPQPVIENQAPHEPCLRKPPPVPNRWSTDVFLYYACPRRPTKTRHACFLDYIEVQIIKTRVNELEAYAEEAWERCGS